MKHHQHRRTPVRNAFHIIGDAFGNQLSSGLDETSELPEASPPEELRQRVIAIAATAGSDEARTREWVAQRYGCPLDQVEGQPLQARGARALTRTRPPTRAGAGGIAVLRSSLDAGVQLIETRSGRYRVALIPLAESAIPGFRAAVVQAVRVDQPNRAIRLTLYQRETPLPTQDGRRAA